GEEGNERSDRIIDTVQLDLEMPPNQEHRAAVAKLLVHPAARRRGIARSMMIALEEIARAERRTLLTLDTVSGSNAELLYRSLDFIAARSEEHTSELQSRSELVCRLLLENKRF